MILWPVVPICERQKRDVNPTDLIDDGLYRTCNVAHAGSGCDPLPDIIERKFGLSGYSRQFVVQLKGCPLKCPYCYVTAEGVNGNAQFVSTDELIASFRKSGCKVFHLMGGAPGIYLDNWFDIISRMRKDEVFHSDLLLMESTYQQATLKKLCCNKNVVIAVSFKASSEWEWNQNTGTRLLDITADRIWENFESIVRCPDPDRFYFTFTNCDHNGVENLKRTILKVLPNVTILPHLINEHFYEFSLKDYKALEK